MRRAERRQLHPVLTAERLRSILYYDPETGIFSCRTQRGPRGAGDILGAINDCGYVVMEIDHRRYLGHRLAFLYQTGAWPKETVDHINGQRADNRWMNLRDVPHRTNIENFRKIRRSTQSGLLGAHKKGARWRSGITVDGKQVNLGTFDTAQQAHEAYLSAKRQHHSGCTI